MPKANPKAWFTSPIATISYRSVDKWAVHNAKFRPYFPTWKEAHDWMKQKAEDRLWKAKNELKSATAFLAKLNAMTDPTNTGSDSHE